MSEANKNLEDLAKAAKLKISQQQDSSNQQQQEDIYADIRNEAESDVTYSNYNFNKPDSNDEIEMPTFEYYEEDDVDIRDADEVLFENGPSFAQVEVWKKQYGEGKVLHTKIIDRHFVFRTLHRYEYKQIVAIENIDPLHREEIICSTVVLWPNKYDFKEMAIDDGGYPSTLAQIIMENSGFTKEYGIEIL